MKIINSVSVAKWKRVEPNVKHNTTNASISPAMFERECKLYDAGILPFEHERYLGEAVCTITK